MLEGHLKENARHYGTSKTRAHRVIPFWNVLIEPESSHETFLGFISRPDKLIHKS